MLLFSLWFCNFFFQLNFNKRYPVGVTKIVEITYAIRLLSIVLLKLAYYAPSTAQNFWKLCPNYAPFSKLCTRLASKVCYTCT